MPDNVRIVTKPWGSEEIFAVTDSYAGKVLVIAAGHSLSLQYHEMKEESIYVIEGEMTLEIGSYDELQTRTLHEGEAAHIPAGTVHRFSSRHGCRIVEVSTPHLHDVVRLQDRYGRI